MASGGTADARTGMRDAAGRLDNLIGAVDRRLESADRQLAALYPGDSQPGATTMPHQRDAVPARRQGSGDRPRRRQGSRGRAVPPA